jgi:hypothetical protein
MPTIDQLAPATASSDTDAIMASQNGVVVKVTRGQVIAGLQPALAIPSGTVLGRASSGTGAPETLTVGANLVINSGTLSATAAYVVSSLPAGTVPGVSDLVAMAQYGVNTGVPYGQFVSGLSSVPGVDASQMLVTATGTPNSRKLADFAAGTLPTGGGTMTGALMTMALQAAPKQYVDVLATAALPIAGGTMTGTLTLASDPTNQLHAATKEYVDGRVTTALPIAGGTMTGLLALASDPVASSQAATKHYVDGQVLTSLPIAGGTMTGTLTLATNPSTPLQAASKQYVDAQAAAALPATGGTMTGALTLASNPTSALQASTKEYVDAQVNNALPKSGGTMTGALTLSANPTSSLQAAPKQYVDTQVGSVFSSLPTAPIIGSSGGQFTPIGLSAGGGLALVGGNLSLAPSGIDMTAADVTPSDTGIAATLGVAIGARLSRTGDASASTVIAAGSTTARALATRFADTFDAKDFGAKGDGVTDDTVAIQNWLTAVGSHGGTGYAPSGTYAVNSALAQTVAGVSVNIRGGGVGNTTFLFTGSTNGFVLTLTRAAGVWGGVRISDISIVRQQTSPAQSNIGLSVIVDSTQGVGYYGNSGLSDVSIVGSSPGITGWYTGILLQNATNFELRNVNIRGPNASGAGADCGISIDGTSLSMFSVQTDITDCNIQGFSTGINAAGFIQGVSIENSAIIGNWWGINWQGASVTTTYATASGVSSGSSTIYLSPANATALLAANGSIVNGAGIAPQSRIRSTNGVLDINISTGAITISPPTTGTITSGQIINFQTYCYGEALSVVNTTFNASFKDILVSWLGFVQITNCSFLRFGLAAATWAAIDLEECNNSSVSANQIIGAFSGSETGIIINSLGSQGSAPNLITANVINGVQGYGIALSGTTENTTTIANTAYACVAAVSASQQNSNPIFGNQTNDSPPDISLNTTTGDLNFNGRSFIFGNSSSVNVEFTINSAAGGGNLNFSENGLANWIVGGSSSNLVLGRCVTPGVLTDVPFVLDSATGGLALLHNLIIGGTFQRQGMASSTPSSGTTVAIPAGISDYRILGGSTLAALIIDLPASPANGQTIRVSSQVAITALALRDGSGSAADIQAPPTALAIGGAFSAQWNSAGTVWWCSLGS